MNDDEPMTRQEQIGLGCFVALLSVATVAFLRLVWLAGSWFQSH